MPCQVIERPKHKKLCDNLIVVEGVHPEQANAREGLPLGLGRDPGVGARQQQRGRIIPRITSLFQFLRVSEPEIERHVNEMDKAGLSRISTFQG